MNPMPLLAHAGWHGANLNPIGNASLSALLACVILTALTAENPQFNFLRKGIKPIFPWLLAFLGFASLAPETNALSWTAGFVVLGASWAAATLQRTSTETFRRGLELAAPLALFILAFVYKQIFDQNYRYWHFSDKVAQTIFLAFSVGLGMALVRRNQGRRKMFGLFGLLPAFLFCFVELKSRIDGGDVY